MTDMAHFAPQVPNHQRLREMAGKIPALDPDDIMAVTTLRAAATELSAHLQQSLDEYGISEARLYVLGYLLDHDCPASHSDLAKASGVTKATITGLIDGLEREGLVRRVASPNDRRVSLIELTAAGKRNLNEILPGHLRRLSQLVGGLNKSERRTLTRLLQKLRAGLPIDSNSGCSSKRRG